MAQLNAPVLFVHEWPHDTRPTKGNFRDAILAGLTAGWKLYNPALPVNHVGDRFIPPSHFPFNVPVVVTYNRRWFITVIRRHTHFEVK